MTEARAAMGRDAHRRRHLPRLARPRLRGGRSRRRLCRLRLVLSDDDQGGAVPRRIELLQWWAETMTVPVVAIGGITVDNASAADRGGRGFHRGLERGVGLSRRSRKSRKGLQRSLLTGGAIMNRIGICAAAFACFALCSGAAPVGATAEDWLRAFNAGDGKALTALGDDSTDFDADIREETGGLDPVHIEKNDGRTVTMLVRERVSPATWHVTLMRDAKKPGQLQRYQLARPMPLPSEKDTVSRRWMGLRTALPGKTSSRASCLSARTDTIFLPRPTAPPMRRRKMPNTLGTKFFFASQGKMFTAVSIFQLLDKGKVSLNDTVGKFLTELSQSRDRAEGHRAHAARAHGRHGRHGNPATRRGRQPGEGAQHCRYHRAERQARTGFQTGHQVGLFELRLHPARRHHRKSVGHGLTTPMCSETCSTLPA